MSNNNRTQHIITARLINKSPSHVRMYASYDTDNSINKGYWLHIQPYTLERCDGYIVERMTGFSGIKAFVQPATRFTAKTLNEIATDDRFNFEFLNEFITQNNLKIANDFLNNHPELKKVIE